MRRKQIVVLFAILVITCPLVRAQDWPGINRYAKANAELSAPAPGEARIVLLGDSITEGWAGQHPDFFRGGYIGRGISGQVSTQFLARFRQDVIDLHPAVVVINAGTNDIAENQGPYDEDRTLGNIISMVQLARANGIKVILSSVLPAARFGWRPSITDGADKIASLNARIEAYAQREKLLYVDYYSAMVSGPERALNPAFTRDGVHPTPAGYDVMEPLVRSAVEKALRSRRYCRPLR